MSPLPQKLLTRLKKFYPENFLDILCAFETPRRGSFRINTLYAHDANNFESVLDEVLSEFSTKKIEIEKFSGFAPEISGEKFLAFCFERKFEYDIKGTDAFYQGKIYLQSLASMIPVLLLNPQKNKNFLDVCAAPGSKTTQLAMMTENSSAIIALEKNALRHQKLEYNLSLQNAKHVTTHKIDALKFFSGEVSISCADEYFDAIVLDVPCSAEGRISLSREKSFGFWTMQNILDIAELQFQIFSSSLKKLAPGGTLIYSTCTLAPEENTELVQKILAHHPEISLEPITQEDVFSQKFLGENIKLLSENSGMITIFPTEYTEGFFVARVKKMSSQCKD